MNDIKTKFNIPKGWRECRISDLLDYERPDNFIVKSVTYDNDNKIPVLTANKSFILGYTDEDFGIYKDVPVIIFDDFTTDSKFVDFPFKIKSSAIKILKPKNKEINLKFVFEKIKSINFPIGNHKRYYISQYQNLEVIVPEEKKEQDKIAEILSKVDEDIEKTEEIIKKTEKLKKGLMQGFFDKKNNTNLEKIRIGDFGDIITGNTPSTSKKEYYGKDFLWVSPKDIGQLKYIDNTEKKLSIFGFEKTRKLPSGAVLMVCIGSTIGKIAIASKEMSTNQQINSIIVDKKFDNEYIYYCLLYNKNKIIEKRSTQAVPILNKTSFSNILIDVTNNKTDQKYISNILSSIDNKIEINKQIKNKLIQLKKGLMNDLLSGEVRV